MTDREMYLAMAEWFRRNTFHPVGEGAGAGCGCFLTAQQKIPCWQDTPLLEEITGVSQDFSSRELIRAGWIEGCTNDAIAACLIAADLSA